MKQVDLKHTDRLDDNQTAQTERTGVMQINKTIGTEEDIIKARSNVHSENDNINRCIALSL